MLDNGITWDPDLDPDNDLFADAMEHTGERRRKRLQGYYTCWRCGHQFIMRRAYKEISCPVCEKALELVTTVDEFEVNRIRTWAGPFLIEQDDCNYVFLVRGYRNQYRRLRKEAVS